MPLTRISPFCNVQGLTPSQIGVILRDSHGVAKVQRVTGAKILRVLKSKGLAPEIPEDLYWCVVLFRHIMPAGGGMVMRPVFTPDAFIFVLLERPYASGAFLLFS